MKEIVELSTDGGETWAMEEEDKAGTWGRGCEKGWGPGNLGASATAAALKQNPWAFSSRAPHISLSVISSSAALRVICTLCELGVPPTVWSQSSDFQIAGSHR